MDPISALFLIALAASITGVIDTPWYGIVAVYIILIAISLMIDDDATDLED